MSTLSKSPIAILKAAHEVARGVLPDYSHRNSPKTFTQPQLFACIVLKLAEADDYRGIAAKLADSPSWREAIGLRSTPEFSTLQKAYHRLRRSGRAQRI
ncbi:hypothetical protein AB1L30_00900, partial [Bremerella sp. JC817]